MRVASSGFAMPRKCSSVMLVSSGLPRQLKRQADRVRGIARQRQGATGGDRQRRCHPGWRGGVVCMREQQPIVRLRGRIGLRTRGHRRQTATDSVTLRPSSVVAIASLGEASDVGVSEMRRSNCVKSMAGKMSKSPTTANVESGFSRPQAPRSAPFAWRISHAGINRQFADALHAGLGAIHQQAEIARVRDKVVAHRVRPRYRLRRRHHGAEWHAGATAEAANFGHQFTHLRMHHVAAVTERHRQIARPDEQSVDARHPAICIAAAIACGVSSCAMTQTS